MTGSSSDIGIGDGGSPHIPRATLTLIDDAFNKAINEARQEQDVLLVLDDGRPAKRRRVSPAFYSSEGAGGGFLAERSFSGAGGFLVESVGRAVPDGETEDQTDDERDSQHEHHEHIPLSLIPHALQILDLDPSDPQTLSVFTNASERPSRSDTKAWSRDDERELEDVVSRSDFRAVCAALLPDVVKERDTGVSKSSERTSRQQLRSETRRKKESSTILTGAEPPKSPWSNLDDDGVDDLDIDESDSSEDEYIPGDRTSTKGGNASKMIRGRTSHSIASRNQRSHELRNTRDPQKNDSTSSTGHKLTARQERDTLMAYSLFFPSLRIEGKIENGDDDEANDALLRGKQLTIKDIAHAAGFIKEKLTAEEIIEMLSFFSKAPNAQVNPTMNFTEFQEMMTTTKLA